MQTFNKLVRNKIPEIIESSGRKVETRILSDEEYIDALDAKLNEEVKEYQIDKNLEEMADVLEILYAICVAKGFSIEQLEEMRRTKVLERGGFSDKIFFTERNCHIDKTCNCICNNFIGC